MRNPMRGAMALLALVVAMSAFADRPELPPAGMGQYLIVLWEPGTPIPGDPDKKTMKRVEEPNIEAAGGRVLKKDMNKRLVHLPFGQVKKLQKHQAVASVQRIWVGEPLEGWDDPDRDGTIESSLRSAEVMLGGTEDAQVALDWAKSYVYDVDGNIQQIGSDQYTYDSVGRLTQATVNGKTETYKYDSFGNLVERAVPQGNVVLTPVDAASNRLAGLAYDAAGNVTTRSDRGTYVYDSLNNLVWYGAPTVNIQPRRILYDVNDERIGAMYGSNLQRWTFRDFDNQVIREFSGGDESTGMPWEWRQDYIRGEGELVAGEMPVWTYWDDDPALRFTYGGKRHYHLDHLGSVRVVTDTVGRELSTHDYLPFGINQTPRVQEPVVFGDNHIDGMRFAGHWRDFMNHVNVESTEYLDYMHARYYDPNLGRFLSVDPVLDIESALSNPQQWNRYSYVRNNPLTLNDPNGRQAKRACDFGMRCGWAAKMQQMQRDDVEADWNEGSEAVRALMPGTIASAREQEDAQSTVTWLAIKYVLPFLIPSEGAIVPLAENAMKGEVLAALRAGEGAMTSAQRAAVIRSVGRATNNESVSVVQNSNGTVTVLKTRPGRDGSQTFVTVVGRAGNSQTVQTARNAAGESVHYDPQGGTSIWRAFSRFFQVMRDPLTNDEREALKAFAKLGISVAGNSSCGYAIRVTVASFRPGCREVSVAPLPDGLISVTRDDIRWVVRRYLHGKTSGEELSNWAGLLLAISAYALPGEEADDDMLALLTDLALPLRSESMDRETLRRRLDEHSGGG